MPLPAAAHLIEFPLTPKSGCEPMAASAQASFGQEIETGSVDQIADAFARGREEGLAAGRADYAARLDEERAASEARLADERAAWSSQEGARLGDAITAAFQSLEASVGDAVAAILSPVLEEGLRRRAVDELAENLKRLMASGQRILRVSGPEDLLQALRARLGADMSAVAFESAQDIDMRVVAEQTTIETQLKDWMPRIDGRAVGHG
jgi:flagellar biosynthesis/type III secretory pathway protein FliH